MAPETLAAMDHDCAEFQRNHAELLEQWYDLGETEERAGHDFWLTRAGHGAGFWDRYYNELGNTLGNQLTKAAKTYGNCDLYIGDDSQIYHA